MAEKPVYTWQRQKLYPNSGEMFDSNNNIVDVASLVKNLNKNIDAFDQLKTVEYSPIVERKPLPSLSMIRDRTVPANSADVYVQNGEIVIDGSLALRSLYTVDVGRYLPGLIGLAGIGVRIPNAGVGHYEYGYGNDTGNRIGIEVDTGNWNTFIESGGVRYYTKARSQWIDPLDGTGPSGITSDLSKHVLRINIGWYGYLSIIWTVAIPQEDGDKLVVIDISGGVGAENSVSLEQPDLPIFAECNGGVMYVGGRQYGVFGRYNPEYRFTSSPAVLKTVGTTYEPILSMQVKNAVNWNGVTSHIQSAGFLSTADCEVAIFIYPTLTGATWAADIEIDANETAFTLDTAATALAGGYKAMSFMIGGGSGNKTALSSLDFPDLGLPANAIITVAARAFSTTADVRATLRVKEEW